MLRVWIKDFEQFMQVMNSKNLPQLAWSYIVVPVKTNTTKYLRLFLSEAVIFRTIWRPILKPEVAEVMGVLGNTIVKWTGGSTLPKMLQKKTNQEAGDVRRRILIAPPTRNLFFCSL